MFPGLNGIVLLRGFCSGLVCRGLFIFIASFLICFRAHSQQGHVDREPVKVTYVEVPPATYTNDNHEAAGFLIEAICKVLQEAGYSWTTRPYPPNRMIMNMISGDAHLWIGPPTKSKLKGNVLVGELPITELYFRAYHYGDFGPIEKKEDLLGRRVIILRGYDYGGWSEYIKNSEGRIKYFISDDHEQALMALSKGRGDILLDYELPITEISASNKKRQLKSSKRFRQSMYFLVSKNAPEAENLMASINRAHLNLLEGDQLVHIDGR